MGSLRRSHTNTVFNFILSARLLSAFWSNISDCDETYNYWEPAHFLIYGKGFQTWEYSPSYALRSYAYVLLYILPAWAIQPLLQPNPIFLFYLTRVLLAVFSTYCEVYFYRGLVIQLGRNIGRNALLFMGLSVGMFISATAFLPSTTSMYLCLLSYGAWFHRNNAPAIFFTALSALFSWPFAGALGIPIAFDILFRQRKLKFFLQVSIISLLFIVLPQILIDWLYYGKVVFAPLNIVWYNIFTSHGPDLYGTEPWYFYVLNGFLNFNVVFLVSLFVVPLGLLIRFLTTSSHDIPLATIYLGFYIWLGIFTFQPHKEERFLFPIYPLICLGAAHFLDCLVKLYQFLSVKLLAVSKSGRWIQGAFICIFALLSCCRMLSLYVNYHAPTSIWIQLNNLPANEKGGLNAESSGKYTVCIGKEWYRFPTSFFLPSASWNIEFLKSDFKGQLPRHFEEGDPQATRRLGGEFNDQNREEKSRYRVSSWECDFIVDQDTGNDRSEREKNYVRDDKLWKVIFSYGMLSTEKSNSNSFLRAFYIPFLSSKNNKFNSYSLLRNEARFKKRNMMKAY